MDNLKEKLLSVLPSQRIHTRLIDRVAYANDASYFHLVPQAVVEPDSIGQIQSLFQFSQGERIPLAFRAAGTNLTGQAVTDGILVDISKTWDRYSVEDGGALLRAQPGLVGGFLNLALKPYGRRIGPDPASLDAAMLGGILANNSGGMCCGVTENSYRTLQSMTFVLPNGFVLDSAASDAHQIFESEQPAIAQGLLDIKQRILANPELAERVRKRYQSKNTNGYSLNAFLDFEKPLDIFIHLMIGSEGTLGFIAEAVLRTLPVLNQKYTALLYFKTIQDAAAAIFPLRESGARAAEILDRAALRSVEAVPGVPPILRELPGSAAAILVEYQAPDAESLAPFEKAAVQTLKQLRLLHDPEFTRDPVQQANLWKPRKGIIASVGAMRAPGTTSLIEDVLFPVPRLADAVTDLQALFATHGYPEGVIYGHAKDGNLHFQINQSFNTQADIKQFDDFTLDLVQVITGKYDGALKAEHGSGRNMAPFVEAEWGPEAYAIMRDIKSLFDPDCLLNPNVLINPDPQAHIKNPKTITPLSPIIDACIECGFCESKCPSRYLTLSPRQRIIVQREIARLKQSPQNGRDIENELISNLQSSYLYNGLETCAVDGLCATACPVSINTGELTKHLRAEAVKGEKVAGWVANNFALVEKSLGWGVNAGHFFDRVTGTKWQVVLPAAQKITGMTVPKWNNSVPYPTGKLPSPNGTRARKGRGAGESPAQRGEGQTEFIYFPSCISRQLGVPNLAERSDERSEERSRSVQLSEAASVTSPSTTAISSPPLRANKSLAETFITIAKRANLALEIPADVTGFCCGMPFSSKGYTQAFKSTAHKTIAKFWEWSEGGKYPIVIDTTSCAYTLRTCQEALSPEDLALYKQMTILDSLEFLHDTLLPRLALHPVDEDVVLHPNCASRKMGLDSKMLSIAQKCARSATVPLNLGCCAFAGDRGLLFPELTASATKKEAAEVLSREYGGYYSSNITCEMGMSEATGKNYVGILYLVDKASR